MDRPAMIAAMIRHSRSLFDRGLTFSTGGNISGRLEEGFLVQATDTSFGRLEPGDFVACDRDGRAESGRLRPSKEASLHAALYRRRPDVTAVVHLHSPASIALGCLAAPTDSGNVLPVVTAGAIARVGRVPLVEYHPPGSARLAARVAVACADVNAVLLQNHGLVTFGPSLERAVDVAEELEQNVRVWLSTGGAARVLSDEELTSVMALGGAVIAAGTQRPALLPGVTWATAR